jgi:hypothetical protein
MQHATPGSAESAADALEAHWLDLPVWSGAQQALDNLQGRTKLAVVTNCSIRLGALAAARLRTRWDVSSRPRKPAPISLIRDPIAWRSTGWALRHRRRIRCRIGVRPLRYVGRRPQDLLAQPGRSCAPRQRTGCCFGAADARRSHPLARRTPLVKLMDIETPAALIDETRMAANIDRMQKHLSALGVRLRPHVKTSKCIEVALRQQEAGAKGITVSTLKEAEQFLRRGLCRHPLCRLHGAGEARPGTGPDPPRLRAHHPGRFGDGRAGCRRQGQGSGPRFRRDDRDRFRWPSFGCAARGRRS